VRLISTVALFVNLSTTWTVACSCFYKELSEGVSEVGGGILQGQRQAEGE